MTVVAIEVILQAKNAYSTRPAEVLRVSESAWRVGENLSQVWGLLRTRALGFCNNQHWNRSMGRRCIEVY